VVGALDEYGGDSDPLPMSGAAYVFTRNHGGGDSWGEVKILHASDAEASDYFGVSVAISGDTLVVGAYGEDGGAGGLQLVAGAAYVFTRNHGGADQWGEVKILQASDFGANDRFGFSVAISGDTLVVGAYDENGGAGSANPGSGAAYIFTRNCRNTADVWCELQILHASDLQSIDHFGFSVAISGNTLLVGAYGEDGGVGNLLPNAGAAYVFNRNCGGSNNWGQYQILHATDAQPDDNFGYSVAISGDFLVIGAWNEDGGPGNPQSNAGAAYIFLEADPYTLFFPFLIR
jgi:hypothetical protein